MENSSGDIIFKIGTFNNVSFDKSDTIWCQCQCTPCDEQRMRIDWKVVDSEFNRKSTKQIVTSGLINYRLLMIGIIYFIKCLILKGTFCFIDKCVKHDLDIGWSTKNVILFYPMFIIWQATVSLITSKNNPPLWQTNYRFDSF